MTSALSQFFWGALALASWVAGLFFAKFWRLSRDRLFGLFALAFWTLALHWTLLGILNPPVETRHRFFAVFSTTRASPPLSADTASTWRENSRTRYDPGVQTAITSSTSGLPPVGKSASTST